MNIIVFQHKSPNKHLNTKIIFGRWDYLTRILKKYISCYYVFVSLQGYFNYDDGTYCTVSVLSGRAFLTAAHCFDK